jgi:hypothetical protein
MRPIVLLKLRPALVLTGCGAEYLRRPLVLHAEPETSRSICRLHT